ncbi:hypothetical protein OC842_000799 [Tilletia horrida]|uniref:Peptidase A1 domain-containing protein n=1 Tax=Tilletia horrida TaxID=155126 RepID=A0AAN6GGE4_9BASI|nr:hypothetical protein OC842_000799 [Tilletia horrida]
MHFLASSLTAASLLALALASSLPPHERDAPRPGEDNEGYPNKVQLRYRSTKHVAPKQERGALTTFVGGNYPPFEIIDTRSKITWDHDQRVFGGGYEARTFNGGADASVQLGRTNGTILAGFNGGELGASPRIEFVYGIDGRIRIEIDGDGAEFACAKEGAKTVCTAKA